MLQRLSLGMLLLCAFSAAAACEWPGWQQYKQYYISPQGRVIDPSSPNKITTSEGQSYGLFFARWQRPADLRSAVGPTENNPAAGDLSARLPAAVGRERRQAVEGAGRQFGVGCRSVDRLQPARSRPPVEKPALSNHGTLLLQRIGREEVADIPGTGLMLLPGKVGFVAEDRWRLNPSYLPPQLLARFAALNGPWRAMRQSISGCGWTLRRTASHRTGWCGGSVPAGSRIPSSRTSAATTPFGFICGPACWRTTMSTRRRCSNASSRWRSSPPNRACRRKNRYRQRQNHRHRPGRLFRLDAADVGDAGRGTDDTAATHQRISAG